MSPLAAAGMVMVGAAVLVGFLVGAIGGAIACRLRSNLALGGLLTAGAYLLVLVAERPGDFRWLARELIWGAPSMALAYLICAVSARWLEARTALRRNWAMLAAFGFTLCMGVLYLLLFRLHPWAPLLAALAADVLLTVLLMRSRMLVRP